MKEQGRLFPAEFPYCAGDCFVNSHFAANNNNSTLDSSLSDPRPGLHLDSRRASLTRPFILATILTLTACSCEESPAETPFRGRVTPRCVTIPVLGQL
jgi:hypothetical protein